MPSSTFHNISFVLFLIRKFKPRTILDCGIGFGKWGFLFREYLDVYEGRALPEDWRIKIDGIEVFSPYLQSFSWLTSIYNSVLNKKIEDVFLEIPKGNYDLIMFGDVLEHIEKEVSLSLLESAVEKTNLLVIASIPLGKEWLNNNIVAGNKYEAHRSVWNLDDFAFVSCKHKIPFYRKDWIENNKKGAVIAFYKRIVK